jgi:hypothetical protein
LIVFVILSGSAAPSADFKFILICI